MTGSLSFRDMMADLMRTGPLPAVAYTSRNRAERVVAGSRLILAAFTLFAIWLDPLQPAKHADTTYALMVVYVGYAVVLAAVVWRSRMPLTRLGIATHVADLGVFALFNYLTEGPGSSPFFSYFAFSLVAGAVRWQWRGAIWTAVAALAAFNATGLYAGGILGDPSFQLNRFIIRSVYLVVLAVLVGYLGAHEARLRGELAGLASWPRAVPAGVDALLRQDLEVAARLLRVPRVLLVWEDTDEPWLRLSLWHSSGMESWTESPERYRPMVAEPLHDAAFVLGAADAQEPNVTYATASDLRTWHGVPLHAALTARFAIGAVLAVPIRSEYVDGRLFALDGQRLTTDDLVLGGIVARQLAASLDHVHLARELQEAAATEERVRLSRDLHDGVLQWLTGAALQLQTVEQRLEHDPRAARRALEEVQRLIADEQRDLRFYIEDLKPTALDSPDAQGGLDVALSELGRRLGRVWGLRVVVEAAQEDGAVPLALYRDVYRLVQEAAVNAARHAKASEVRVSLGVRGDWLELAVSDDGCGFPFQGRFDHADLTAQHIGPRTLRERVTALGGTLSLETSGAGTRLEMRLPVGVETA
jgi:signal transduction histidine kinase